VAPGVTPTAVRLEVEPQPWDGKSRVTVLVMGLDYRDWVASDSSPRSDTMMLITIDPLTLQAGMLSIPRDLWVEIPGFKHNRINTAYMLGEAYNLPGGGPALAQQTVENLLGVPVTYFAVIDFHTFERLIDEIGGIDVLVKERIRIAPIGAESSYLEAKPYHLNGAEALAYARVRKNAGGDFGRAERQQQVILAALDRVVGFDILPGLVTRSPALYQELATGIRTNLTLEQIVSLAWLALKVPKENIQSGAIAPPKMVGFYTRPDGAQVLRFVPDQIRILRDDIFVETSAFGPTLPELPEGGYAP
jgi:LCP family protein required for cell wall assembly